MPSRPARESPSRLEVDHVSRAVRLDGEAIRLGGRAFDLLASLASHPGRVFSSQELLAAVWPARVVEENNLRVQVAQLRERLGSGSIINVARHGYALSTAGVAHLPSPLIPAPARRSVTRLAGGPARDSKRLRADDFRAIFRLLGECGELWADPVAWQKHLLESVARMIRLPIGLHAELSHFHPGGQPQILSAIDHGWEDAAHADLFRQGSRQPDGPFNSSPLDRHFRQLFAQHGDATLTSAQILSDSEWTHCDFYNHFHRPARMDHMIHSAIGTGADQRVHLLAFGGSGHRTTPRDSEMVQMVHRELVSLIGTRLATDRHRSMQGLDRTQRQVLDCALTGADDHRIAEITGLRLSAVRLRIEESCAHFGVRNLRQVTAYLLQRRPQPSVPVDDKARADGSPPLR